MVRVYEHIIGHIMPRIKRKYVLNEHNINVNMIKRKENPTQKINARGIEIEKRVNVVRKSEILLLNSGEI